MSAGPDARTVAWYDGAAPAYAKGRAPAPRHLDAFIAALPPGGAVLDLGCGGGNATAPLCDAGFEVTALDASPGLIALARKAAPGARFILGDFADVTGTALYDGVWANYSLLHAPRADMPAHLARLAGAMKPGALLHLAMILGTGEVRDGLDRFYAYYSAEELHVLLTDAGFSVEAETQQDSTSTAGGAIRQIVLRARLG